MNFQNKIILGLVSLLIGHNASAQWSIKPSGTTNGINATKFLDGSTGFACGDYNTLLKTSDGGATWQPVSTGNIAPMTFLAIDALSKDKFFVTRNGVYATTDGGKSWTEWGNLSTSAYSIQSIKAINDSTALITKGGNVFKTSDKGANWTSVYFFPDLTGPMVFAPNSDTGFAVSGRTWDNVSYGTIHRTTDRGNTWTDLTLDASQISAIFFRNGYSGYYTNIDKEVYKTTDGGVSWQLVGTVGLPAGDYINGIAFTDLTKGYVISQLGFVYKTLDGGATWAKDRDAQKTPDGNEIALNSITVLPSKHVLITGNAGLVIKNDGTLSVPGTQQSSVRMFPNPATTHLDIELSGTAAFDKVCVFDLSGRMLLSTATNGKTTTRIDLQQFAKGTYIIMLSGAAEKYSARISVQ